MIEKLTVTVRNKTTLLLETDCLSVSMINKLGPFDILPEHANFVSLIKGEVVVRDLSDKVWRQSCLRGVAQVTNNLVSIVFLEEKI